MAIQQSHFRIRPSGGDQAANANGGGDWAADVDVNATLDMLVEYGGLLTGVRIELEEIDSTSTTIIPKLQYRLNSGTWTDVPDKANENDDYDDPGAGTLVYHVAIVNRTNVTDGTATTNIIDQSAKTFVAATLEFDRVGASVTLNDEHTEIEWRVIIRRSASSPVSKSIVDDGDVFEFRVVESDDTILGGSYVIPAITVNVPVGYMGGTGTETSANFSFIKIPDGTLYAPLEEAENGAEVIMWKSGDGGDSWSEMDVATALNETDMESWSMQYDDTNKVIHCLHISGACTYYQFGTKDHATNADQWLDIDDPATIKFHTLEAGVDAINQSCDLILRGSTLYAFYPDLNTTDQIFYRKKPDLGADNDWASRVSIDSTIGDNFSGVAAVLGPNSNLIHIFYTNYTDSDLFHVSLSTGDSLGAKHTVETDMPTNNDVNHGMTNAVCWYNGSNEKAMIGYVDHPASNGYLWTVIVQDDSSPDTRQNASNSVVVLTDPTGINSRQPVASLGHDTTDDTTYVFFAQDSDEDVYYATNADGAGWTGHTEFLDGVNKHSIRGQVFTHGAGIHGGDRVFGMITDNVIDVVYSSAPNAGWTGSNRYDEFQIEAGSVDTSDRQPAYAEGLRIFPFSEDFSVGGDGDEWSRGNWVTASG